MNSRFVPITAALASLFIAVFIILYFNSLWRWVIASPLLVLVTFPCLKIGFFSPQEEVDKLTGADKFERPISSLTLLYQLISFSRYFLYIITVYFSYVGFSLYVIPLIAVFVSFAKTFSPLRFNIIRDAKMRNGYLGVLKSYSFFYVQDLIVVCVVYGVGLLIQMVFQA